MKYLIILLLPFIVLIARMINNEEENTIYDQAIKDKPKTDYLNWFLENENELMISYEISYTVYDENNVHEFESFDEYCIEIYQLNN